MFFVVVVGGGVVGFVVVVGFCFVFSHLKMFLRKLLIAFRFIYLFISALKCMSLLLK